MASAVTPRWHGDNYQSRFFWERAMDLLRPGSGVVAVTFEADGPKAFDDVIVAYDPPLPRSRASRVSADHFQIKWHVQAGGRFGYADLIDPAFIGAQSISILERLRDAQAVRGPDAAFTLVTTDRIKDGDPLSDIIFNHDRSILTEKLFDGTRTDASRMGAVRALWRDHLKVTDDAALEKILTGLRIYDGHVSLEELRRQIEWRAQAAGLRLDTGASDFRLDELARQLKVRGINKLTKPTLLSLLAEEGFDYTPPPASDATLPVAIRTFQPLSADIVSVAPENTLTLTDQFRARYLQHPFDWERDIRPPLDAFLRNVVRRAPRIQLILDAHASIALLAGAVLDLKSGANVALVQKGRLGGPPWRADDGTQAGAALFIVTDERIGKGSAIAVAVSATQAVEPQMRRYLAASLPDVGRVISFAFADGPGQTSVRGGAHAAALAEQIANTVRAAKADDLDASVHLFAACPNSLLFFLGQQHQGYAPATVYEFDFDRGGNKSYVPAFTLGA